MNPAPFSITGGLLVIGDKRILLTHITSYSGTQSGIVITTTGGKQESVHVGPSIHTLLSDLDLHFAGRTPDFKPIQP